MPPGAGHRNEALTLTATSRIAESGILLCLSGAQHRYRLVLVPRLLGREQRRRLGVALRQGTGVRGDRTVSQASAARPG